MVPALERGLRIIELLAENNDGLRFVEIQNEIKIPKPSLSRLLRVLVENSYLTKSQGGYRLGNKFLYLSLSLIRDLDLRKKAYPHLIKLKEQTNETVELEILEGTSLIVIEKIESEESIRLFSQIGGKYTHLHATAPGKVVLAYMLDQELKSYIEKHGLVKITKNTITNLSLLKKHLTIIRQKGVAFDDQEMREGVRRIAAPVFDFQGKITGLIDLAGPVFRMNLKKINNLQKLVKGTALNISRDLGFSH